MILGKYVEIERALLQEFEASHVAGKISRMKMCADALVQYKVGNFFAIYNNDEHDNMIYRIITNVCAVSSITAKRSGYGVACCSRYDLKVVADYRVLFNLEIYLRRCTS